MRRINWIKANQATNKAGTVMKFTKTHILDKNYPYRKDYNGYYEWHSGIYHIVCYSNGEFHAYYIPDNFKNWGNHVSPPPDYIDGSKCWKSLKRAKKACKEHAATHSPSNRTIRLASQLFDEHVSKSCVHAT